ncbi:glutathione S-transferase [Undibacterium parvum]|uniref:Glutathione S-transferase n=2 Tax=Undibacterium TaxID=401469 RepID=A0A6M4A9V6_9BURK|nr:glutathione S-transferase [Undibacterium parvum]AZP13168.1 glutathione S-transferase [Undibacterium parvum]QJQ07277.1 glutathione S-transferase [Undibacterium piscinae]
MKLIGMLDSPYVRRVAISLQLLDLRFEHQSLSVFGGFAEFQQINPVVKAPTLVCDEGAVLMDSSLILELAEAMAAPGKSLLPATFAERQHALRLIGLALAACEKSVQIVYELKLRPAEKIHAPWLERVQGQMLAAYTALEAELQAQPLSFENRGYTQAGISTAVAWHFTQQMHAEMVPATRFPALQAFSVRAEAQAPFMAAPHGASTYFDR